MRLGLAFVSVGLVLVAWACAAPPPKQREDWTISPVRYGDTRYEGLRAPRAALTAEADDAAAP
jgi:hypothetical protein